MRKLTIEVTWQYDVEIDDDNFVVKEYNSDQELFDHCADYQFGNGLPVILNNGVKVLDSQVLQVAF